MSNFDPKMRGPDYRSPLSLDRWSSGSWIAGAVIAVLLLIAVGYVFSDRSSSPVVEHRAAATDTDTTPATKPLAAPTVNPSTVPATPSTPDANKP